MAAAGTTPTLKTVDRSVLVTQPLRQEGVA
jgi:hypothetical protein